MIKFTVKEKKDFSIVEFELEGPVAPEELKKINPPKVNTRNGVVISGRGPIWLYGYLIHEFHPAPWVACYDPRIGGVVVASHKPGISEGDIIPVEE